MACFVGAAAHDSFERLVSARRRMVVPRGGVWRPAAGTRGSIPIHPRPLSSTRISGTRPTCSCGRTPFAAPWNHHTAARTFTARNGVPRGGSNPPPPKFRSFDKAEPNSQFRGKYIRNNLIRIRVSFICKLSVTPD
jgi:hypothetical protein